MEVVRYVPPVWASGLRHIPLRRLQLVQRTPIERHVLRKTEVLIKRDDLAGAATYLSGNKARKLELLGPLMQGRGAVLTAGGTNSNSARAVAALCARLGVRCHLVLRKDASTHEEGNLTGNHLLCRLFGASVSLVSVAEYRQWGQHELLKRAAKSFDDPYVLPVGCSVPEGVFGYVNFVDELMQQKVEMDLPFNRIVFASGSGGTASGLAVAKALCPGMRDVKLLSFSVCDTPESFYQHVQNDLDTLGLSGVNARDLIEFRCAKGPGYGVNTEDDVAFWKEVAASTGLVLDGAYTLKAFKNWFVDCGGDHDGHRTLFIHTGGFASVFSVPKLRSASEWD